MKRVRRSLGHGHGRAAACAAGVLLLAALCGRDAWASADCIVSSAGVSFSIYDPLDATPKDSTGTVDVTCTYTGGGASQIAYSVRLSTGSSGTYTVRRMNAGSMRLDYNLYSDARRTSVWGDGLGGTTRVTGGFTVGPGVGNGQRQASSIIYGRMPARQDALDGTFADTIVVTLEF